MAVDDTVELPLCNWRKLQAELAVDGISGSECDAIASREAIVPADSGWPNAGKRYGVCEMHWQMWEME